MKKIAFTLVLLVILVITQTLSPKDYLWKINQSFFPVSKIYNHFGDRTASITKNCFGIEYFSNQPQPLDSHAPHMFRCVGFTFGKEMCSDLNNNDAKFLPCSETIWDDYYEINYRNK